MNPFCSKCDKLLIKAETRLNAWEIYRCPSCSIENPVLVGEWLPTDEDTNRLFENVVSLLISDGKLECEDAIAFAETYYRKFTNSDYCSSIGIPVQDDDFFHHESAGGVALRIIYYLVLNNDPKNSAFIEWRSNRRFLA